MAHACITSDDPLLIVGFGLAGAIMAWKFWEKGIPFEILDEENEYRASHAAAGIMNPITGRVYTLTWNYEALWAEALPFYSKLQEKLNVQFFRSMPLYRGIETVKSLNDWNVRAEMIPHDLMKELVEPKEINPKIEFQCNYFGRVDRAHQLNISGFVAASKKFFLRHNVDFKQVLFKYKELDSNKELRYKGKKYSGVVFCEGAFLQSNPFFPNVKIRPSKGEVLIIKSNSLDSSLIFKDRNFVCPLFEENTFWIGSNYNNHFKDPAPSKEMYEELKSFLESLKIPDYQILRHISGIRPTVADRKPLVGFHKEDSRLMCFNGMGTKGSSLGPWSANVLMNFLYNEIPIPKEVNVSRYY